MSLSTAVKTEIIKSYGQNPQDTGSSETQIALLTERIRQLTEHVKQNPKDLHSRYGLTNMVSRRRRLMVYLKRTDLAQYRQLIERLKLRDSL